MDQWPAVVEDFDQTPNTTIYEASITITGGRARAGAVNTARSIYRPGLLWLDSYFEIEVVTFGAGTLAAGGYLRLDTAGGAAYSINFDSSQVYVDNRLVGNIFTGGLTLGGLPGIFRGEVQGDIVRAYWKGQLVATVQNSGVTAPGVAALYMYSSIVANSEINRFEAGPLGPCYYPPCQQVSRGGPAPGMR